MPSCQKTRIRPDMNGQKSFLFFWAKVVKSPEGNSLLQWGIRNKVVKELTILWIRRKLSSHPLEAAKLEIPSVRAMDLASRWSIGPVTLMPRSFWALYQSQTSRFVSSLPVTLERLLRELMCGFNSASFSSHSRRYNSRWPKMLRICVLPHPNWTANWRMLLPDFRAEITWIRSAKLNSCRRFRVAPLVIVVVTVSEVDGSGGVAASSDAISRGSFFDAVEEDGGDGGGGKCKVEDDSLLGWTDDMT